jgi:hypothetical protein
VLEAWNPCNALWWFLENILHAGQRLLNRIRVSKPVECQLKMTNVQDYQEPAKKCWIILRTPPRRPSPNKPWARRYRWDQLWSLPGDLNRKFEHAPHCSFTTTTRTYTRAWEPQSLWLKIPWLWFPLLPNRQTQPPVISLCFPNWKWNWRDDVLKQCVTSKGNRKRHSTALWKWLPRFFRSVEKLRDRCISIQGDYFEGDCSHIWISSASIPFLT